MHRLSVCIALWFAASRFCSANGIVKGPYLMKPTPHGITVCWVSSTECKGEVVFREDRPSESESAVRTARDSKATLYHWIGVSGLKPYTSYVYHVACGEEWSPIAVFKTAAEPGTPFRFIAYGDNRSQPLVHSTVVERMRKFAPDFVVQTGDLVANGLNRNAVGRVLAGCQTACARSAFVSGARESRVPGHRTSASSTYRGASMLSIMVTRTSLPWTRTDHRPSSPPRRVG